MNSADSTVMMMFLDVSVANVAMPIFSPIKISKSRIPKSIRWATTNISVVTRSNHIRSVLWPPLKACCEPRRNVPLSKPFFRTTIVLNTPQPHWLREPESLSGNLRKKFQKSRLRNCTKQTFAKSWYCLLYTSPSPRDLSTSRMPSSA